LKIDFHRILDFDEINSGKSITTSTCTRGSHNNDAKVPFSRAQKRP